MDQIPIEWMYKWIENIPNNWREYEVSGQVRKVQYSYDKPAVLIPCITDMIEDWKAENKQFTFSSFYVIIDL